MDDQQQQQRSQKDPFLNRAPSTSPRRYSNHHLLLGNSINGMNFQPKYKEFSRNTSRRTKRLLHLGDTFLTLFVITPLAVTHWRGTWVFMDHQEENFPAWHCFLIGGVLHTAFALLRQFLHQEFAKPSDGVKSMRRTIVRHIVTKVYTYIFSIGCIMHWRGGWAVFTEYYGKCG